MTKLQQAHHLFVRLIHDVYNELRHEVPAIESDPIDPITFEVTVQDIEFAVSYNPVQSLEQISIFCRFGKIPEHIELEVLYRLLELNLVISLMQSTVLGIDPESREVVYHFKVDLKRISAPSLLQALSLAANQAKRWHTDHFLEDFEKPIERGTLAARSIA